MHQAEHPQFLKQWRVTMKSDYIERYLREFSKQLPGVDLASAIQAADAHFETSPDSAPEEDARSEASYWREAA